MTEPLFTYKGGQNYPSYRNRESQVQLLAGLLEDALERAVLDEGRDPSRLYFETEYHTSRSEPQCCYGKVYVYDRYDMDGE